ncbi:MAG TPA: hypothetical protein VJS42_13175 [Steroidobacteraceae bacterium]|nr:hypothetical protein [Steroidobacteraceae bacterium]
MAIPWMQIVKWMPSIVQVSRELIARTQREPPIDTRNASHDELAQRIARLEDNERRQAELVNQMAEQLSQFSQVLLIMRRRQIWLGIALAVAAGIAIAAVVLATR